MLLYETYRYYKSETVAGDGERIRQRRLAAGLSQSELARRAGVSRQALGAMEAGVYQPGVGVALRLARLLGESVERLFGESAEVEPPLIEASWAGATAQTEAPVALGRVGGKLVAVPLPLTELRLTAAGGVAKRAASRSAAVRSLRSPAQIDATLLIAGCDPAATLLGDWFARERRPESAVVVSASSAAALEKLAGGHIHAAGVHLAEPSSGDNAAAVAERLRGRAAVVLVHFAEWELGFATQSGNPLGITDVADLARPGLRLINREAGSGARMTLDRALNRLGIDAARVTGYESEAHGHLAVATAIAEHRADLGLTLRVAADAYGLGFVPLHQERYELAIAASELDSAPVEALMNTLCARRFAREVAALCGYDTRRMGDIVAHIQ
jgi:molybdate-binding protein/transcriptional regulator with XRE-family HTH domain